MTSSPVVLAPAFFLEAVAEALLFLVGFAIADGGLFSSSSSSVVSSASVASSVSDDDSVALSAI
jgi:hypothetical protein